MALGQPILLAYAVAVWIAVASFVHFYEEPALSRRFGPPVRGLPACRASLVAPPAPVENRRA